MPPAPSRSSCSRVNPWCWNPKPQPDIDLLGSPAPSQPLSPLSGRSQEHRPCAPGPFPPLEVQVCHCSSPCVTLWAWTVTPGAQQASSSQCHPTGELLLILQRNHLDGSQELSGENPQGLIPEGLFGALLLTGGGASVSLLPLLLLLSEVLEYSKAVKGDDV